MQKGGCGGRGEKDFKEGEKGVECVLGYLVTAVSGMDLSGGKRRWVGEG